MDDAGHDVVVGGEKQRALLALLLLHANELVSSERLIEGLWGTRAPASAGKALQVHVSRLRRVLAAGAGMDGAALTTGPGGYALEVPRDRLDAVLFEDLLEQGRALSAGGDPSAAAGRLRQALGLWRGSALADLALEEFAQPEIRRLEDLRLLAIMERIDADLALGGGAELIGELQKLIASHPLQERLRAQLMRALYRAGRQADALEVYRQTSELLRDELGLEPSRDLQQLERSILEHEIELQPEPGAHAEAERPLPIPATSFLGRGRELSEITEILRSGTSRLLTLTGAGGSGKTRLALRAAEECATGYRDGVWFVSFADITDPQLIAATICQTLGLVDQSTTTPQRRLEKSLKDRKSLLLLDNLEQLVDGARSLGELLASCPRLTLFVTSREPLHLAGEQQYEVPALVHEEAVELFLARARSVAPTRSIEPDEADRICERVDCLPLAIELAAARVKAISPPEILDRLQTVMPVLGAGPRDAPRRQRTLTATIDWSFHLLNPAEQQLFTRLAVFAGGFTLDAAEKVCGADVDTLHSLVDRSLVRAGSDRYWMLQTIRDYALQRLEQAVEEQDVGDAHARWLVELLADEGLPQPGRPNERSMVRVASERENFRSALEWASRNGNVAIVATLASSLAEVWVRVGQLQEAKRWIALALEHEHESRGRLAAQVLSAARAIAWHEGDYAQTTTLVERALALWLEVGDPVGIGKEMISKGRAAAMTGDWVRARADLQEAARFAREHGLTETLQVALNDLGDVAIHEGQLAEGRSLCEESLAIPAPGSTTRVIALINLAHIANLEGRDAEATLLAHEALGAALARGDILTGSWAAVEAAWPLARQGDLRQSAHLLASATRFLERTGAKKDWMIADCEAAVNRMLQAQLEPQTVRTLFTEGRGMSLEEALSGVSGRTLTLPSLSPGGRSRFRDLDAGDAAARLWERPEPGGPLR